MRQLSLKIEKMSVVAGMLGAPVKLGAADPAPPVGGVRAGDAKVE